MKRLHIKTSPRRCNNYCIFCLDNTNENVESVRPYTTKEVEEQMKEARYKYNLYSVLFTSGEPTINLNLLEWIKIAKQMGFSEISLITNGRMFYYKDFAKKLLDSGVNFLIVSIHGHNARIHNAHTRNPDSFKQTYQGLKNISQLKGKFSFKFGINCTLTKMNYKHIDKFLDMLLRFKPDVINFNPVEPAGRAERFAKILLPKYSEVINEFCKIIKKKGFLERKENLNPEIIITAPPCLFRKEFFPFISNFEDVFTTDKSNKIEQIKQLARGERTKRKDCEYCRYFNSCDGVSKKYIAIYGWEEFEPIHSKYGRTEINL